MKLGSSRGMDTKRPRGSERSKPRHELQLTRPSQPPYPWPPEQAQPGVSKPCRTTKVLTAPHSLLLYNWVQDPGSRMVAFGFVMFAIGQSESDNRADAALKPKFAVPKPNKILI